MDKAGSINPCMGSESRPAPRPDVIARAIPQDVFLKIFSRFLEMKGTVALCALNRYWDQLNRSNRIVELVCLKTIPMTGKNYARMCGKFLKQNVLSITGFNFSDCSHSLSKEAVVTVHGLSGPNVHVSLHYPTIHIDLRKFTNLRSLTLEPQNSRVVFSLGSLSTLQELGFSCSKAVTNKAISHLSKLQALTSLDLTLCAVSHLSALRSLTALQCLNLHGCNQLTDLGLSPISVLTNLKGLNLGRCQQLSNVGLSCLSGLTGMESLDLRFCERLTDMGLFYLNGFNALQILNLGGCRQVTDVAISHMRTLPSLQILDLAGYYRLNYTAQASKTNAGFSSVYLKGHMFSPAMKIFFATIGCREDFQSMMGFSDRIITISKYHIVRIWPRKKGPLLATLASRTDKIKCLTLLPDGDVLIGYSNGTSSLWNKPIGCVLS